MVTLLDRSASRIDGSTPAADIGRREFIAGAAALSALVVAQGGTAGAAEGGFPRTVETPFGRVEIPSRPKRVVAVGDAEFAADASVALGVVPVAMPRSEYTEDGYVPWLRAVARRRDVELLDLTPRIPVERIAGLRPDLIVGPVTSDTDFDRLSEIAPVVAYSYSGSWQAQLRSVGRALGRSDRAREIVSEVEDDVAAVRAKHPTWVGKTFTFSNWFDGSIGTLTDPDDTAITFLESLGLSLSPKIRKAADQDGVLSLERIDLLDADLVMFLVPDEAAWATLEAVPGFSNLAAVRDGRFLTVSPMVGYAMRLPSSVNIRWVLDRLEGDLARVFP
jgi:iron complex transport system substrate-binding protein